jgi:hypothetical protein
MILTTLRVGHSWNDYWGFLNLFEWLIPVVLGGGAVAIQKYWQRVREGRAVMWPSASAVVQAANVRRRHGYWAVDVSYRYYAQQEYRYGEYRRDFHKKDAAQAFAAAIRSKSLQVRYREDNPAVSVLMERDVQLAGALAMH